MYLLSYIYCCLPNKIKDNPIFIKIIYALPNMQWRFYNCFASGSLRIQNDFVRPFVGFIMIRFSVIPSASGKRAMLKYSIHRILKK